MATKTTNYNLTKPDLNDWADIRTLNANMDIIDDAMKNISDLAGRGTGNTNNIDLSSYALKSQLSGYLPITGGNVTGTLTYNGVEVATVKTIKQGTKKGEEATHWKTYLQDGRVMFKITVGTQSRVTLPVAMANTQYSVIQCDNTIFTEINNAGRDYHGQVCNHGIKNKSTTGFDVYSCIQVANATYLFNYWARGSDNYLGTTECIIIGWEA